MFKKKSIPSKLKSQVVVRDNGICQLCGKKGYVINLGWEIKAYEDHGHSYMCSFEIDHIIPESLGGKTTLDNLQLLCRHCNRSKSTKIISHSEKRCDIV